VVLKIYDTLGQEVRNLIEASYEAGHHQIRWDGKDNNGNLVSSGIYLFSIKTGDFFQKRKMSLVR
jgi:flagellar hook assembly protein FlgD